jgi:hypothetical protein
MAQVRVTPSGIMDKDTEVSYVNQGNYTDANNIRHRQTDGGNFAGIMPIKGNTLSQLNLDPAIYSPSVQNGIPNYPADSKKFKIKIDITDILSGSINTHSGLFYLNYEYVSGTPAIGVGGAVSYGRDTFASVDVSVVNDTITFLNPHYLQTNDTVKFIGTSLPAPLNSTTTYYVIYVNATTIKLSLTSSGAAINITTTGTGGTLIPLTLACIHKLQGAIDSVTSGLITYSGNAVIGNIGTFDAVASGDFFLEVDNTTGIVCQTILTNEYVATSGSFSIIGSKQLDDDIFIFSASNAVSSGEISLISEIGVIYSTDNNATFNYRTLIRSKKLAFSKYKQIDCEIEKVGSQINLYFTDNLNAPRVIYLKSSLKRTTNGLLDNGLNAAGKYDLQTIDIESSLILPNFSAYIDELEVIQGSGSLTAGNKRYTGRFLTVDYSTTDFLYPTNPINIFEADLNSPFKITGNLPSVLTDKAVKMKVKNITPGIFAYFELVAIEYKGESQQAVIVQRFPIDDADTEITISHTNRGQENIELSFAQLLSITQKYTKAKTLRIFDNRMTMSNVSVQVDSDLSGWASLFSHTIKRSTLPTIGKVTDLTTPEINFSLNEYINPNNVVKNTSYMYNDTYRFGVQVQWKQTSKWSLPYWVDDIRIDNQSTNWNLSDNRRTGSVFSDCNLTDSTGSNVYIYYVNFSNINLDYVVNGQPLRNQISAIRFVRSERIPEVIATGYFYCGAKATTNEIVPFMDANNSYFVTNYPKGSNNNLFVPPTGLPYPYYSTNKAEYVFFYSPDYYYNKNGASYQKQITDKILLTKESKAINEINGTCATGTVNTSLFKEDTGYYDTSSAFTSFNIDKNFYIEAGSTKLDGTETIWSGLRTTWDQAACREVNVFKLTTNAFNTLGGVNGVYYGQIFRNIGAGLKYPANKELSVYESTGHLYILKNTDSGSIDSDVFGGDVFNQKTYMLLRMGQPSGNVSGGAGYVVGLYSQNVLNTQMYYYTEWDGTTTGSGYSFPQYVNKIYSGSYYKLYSYNFVGFSGSAIILDNVDGLVVGTKFFVNGNLTDTLFGTYDTVELEIVSVNTTTKQVTVKSALYGTLPNGSWVSGTGVIFKRRTTETISANSIGSGLFAYAQQQLSVSNNNTYSKSYDYRDNTITEKSYDSKNTFDGNKPGSIAWSAKKEIGSLKDNYRVFQPSSFVDLDVTSGEISHHEIINNNFYTFQEKSVQRQYFRDPSAIGGDNGSDIIIGSGSIMVSRGQEITNTGTSKKWSVIKGKTAGGKETVYWFNDRLQKIMRFGEDGSRVISDKGLLSYLLNNGKYNINTSEPLRGLGINGIWNDRYSELIMTFKYNDGSSDKAFTLVYDELKNGFICFHTYFPNLYIPYNNNFFSVDPSNSNRVYLHDSGSESTFYGTAQDANIEIVMNYEPNISKNFEALQIASEQKPYAANFTTKNHISFLVQNDFDLREDLYYSNIKNDSTGTGVNSNNTSRLWGRWLKIKINLKSTSVGQKLINAIVKFRVMPRLYNQ